VTKINRETVFTLLNIVLSICYRYICHCLHDKEPVLSKWWRYWTNVF